MTLAEGISWVTPGQIILPVLLYVLMNVVLPNLLAKYVVYAFSLPPFFDNRDLEFLQVRSREI